MSDGENRKNLKLTTVYELSYVHNVLITHWLKQRIELLCSYQLEHEARSLAIEFDNYEKYYCSI